MSRLSVLVVIIVVSLVQASAVAQDASPPTGGEGQTLATFDASAGQFPEGVAVAPDGAVYASFSPLGQLIRIAPGQGSHEVVGTIAGLQEGDAGLLGLSIGADGHVYGAVASANADARGVWRFDLTTGASERVPGTEDLAWPNSIAIDNQGTLYVTDSLGGAVWRVSTGGTAEMWMQHDLLAGTEIPIGANGIAIDDSAGTLFVGVSAQGTVVSIPILDNGSAGEPTILISFTNDQGMVGVDGVALDGSGNIYVAQPMANAVVRVNPDRTVDLFAAGEDGLDGPTSVAVGTSAEGAEYLFVANWSDALGDFAPQSDAGPSLVAIPLGS